VAATGGAFAQATMTGAVAYGWNQATTSAGASTSGVGVNSNQLNFAISEDLGEGMKLSAAVGFNLGAESGTGSTGRDTVLTLTTASMGKFTFANTYGGNYLANGIAAVGSDYEQDNSGGAGTGGALGTRSVNDSIGWSMPLSPELTIGITYQEPTIDGGVGGGASGTAANTGDYQRSNTYSLTYKSGPLAANFGYRTFDMANAATANSSTLNRGQAAYDMGVAKIGAGWSQTTTTYGNTSTDTLVGLAIPLGKLTLSTQLANRTTAGNRLSSADVTYSGKVLTAVYSLSKRTDVLATYKTWDAVYGATSTPSNLTAVAYHYF
jgi:hypothetical protein